MTEPPISDDDQSKAPPPGEMAPSRGPLWKDNFATREFARRYRCRKTRLGISACALYVAALVIFFGYALPLILTEEKVVAGATRMISALIGSQVTAESYRFGYNDGPSVELTNAAIIDRNGAPSIRAEHISVTVDILRSLTRGFSLSTFTLRFPVIDITRYDDGSFNYPLADRIVGEESTAPAPFPAGALRIEHGTISWVDHAITNKPVRLRLEQVNGNIAVGPDGGGNPFTLTFVHRFDQLRSYISIKGAFGADPAGRRSSVVADIDIRRVPIDAYWPYLRQLLPFKRLTSAVSLKGKLNADTDGAFDAEGELRFDDVSLLYPAAYSQEMWQRNLSVDFRIKGDDALLTVDQATLRSGPLTFTVAGKAHDYRGADPDIEMRLDLPPVDVTELRRLAPDRFLTPVQTSFLNETVGEGKVSLSDVTFQGRASLLRQIDRPDVRSRFKGKLTVTDASLQFEQLTHSFNHLNGSATFDGDRLTLDGIEGRYGASAITDATGLVENLHQWPTYRVGFKADLDLNEARQILAKKVTSQAFREKILDVEKISGDVILDLSVSGDTRHPVESLSVSGDLRISDVTFRHSYLGQFHHLNGHITGDRSVFNIEKITWLAASSPFVMTGSLKEVFKPTPIFDLTLGATPHLADLDQIPFLAPRHRLRNPDGFAQIDMRLAGTFGAFTIDQTVDLTSAGFALTMVIEKRPGKIVRATFSGATDGDALNIGRVDLTVGSAKAVVTGAVGSMIQGKGIDLAISSDHIEADDIDDFFAFMDDIDGEGSASGAITIRYTAGEAPQLGGQVDIKKGRFKLPLFVAPFHDVDGSFALAGSHVFLKGVTGHFGGADFGLEGDAALSSTLPLFTLNVTADKLSLYDFFGAPTWEGASQPASPPPPVEEIESDDDHNYFDAPWRIAIHSSSGTIGFLTYRNLDTTVTYKDDVFYITPLTFEGHGGSWIAPLTITMTDSGDLLFDGKADIFDLAIDRYLTEAAGATEVVEGAFTLSGAYKAHGYYFADIMRSLEGGFTLSSGPGVIRRFAMISKIFSLLNVSQYFRLKAPDLTVDGMPFDHMMGSFSLYQGVATTDDLRVESEAIRLIGKGDYDIATGEVDMVITAAPFVTIDRIVSAIPVAGYVLAGEEESFLASSFTVTDALSYPTVKAIPFESLAKGTWGIVKRFFTLPVKAVELLDEPDAPKVGDDQDDIN